jgi:hypothetical protein
VAYHATQTIFREKESRTLDELRLTGIEPSDLVRGKIRGMFLTALPYFLGGAVPSLIAVACLCALLTSPGWGRFRDVAGHMVKAINAADYEGIRKDFNKGMLEAFPVERCRTFFRKELSGKFGKINELEPPQFKSASEAVFVARCEHGTLDFTLVLDDQGRVAGMWFWPVPTAPRSWSPSLLATSLYLAFAALQLYAAIVFGFFLSMRLKSWWRALLATLVMSWAFFFSISAPALAPIFPAIDAVLIVLPAFAIFVFILIAFVRFLIEAFATWDPSKTLRRPPSNIFLALILNQFDWNFYFEWNRKRHWNHLGDPDDVRAERAIIALLPVMGINAVPLLKERLHPVPPVDPQRIEQLLQEAAGEDGGIQEKACRELASLDGVVESRLMKKLACPAAQAWRDRAVRLLEKIERHSIAQELLRGIRAVEVLELIAKHRAVNPRFRPSYTEDARQVLRSLAEGAPEAPLTQAARAALQRLGVAN